jgi:AraC-like DNA-binding protein
MGEEARALHPGGEAVLTRLADVLVIQAVRHWMQRDPAARTGWLGALQDARIGRTLAAVQRDPARLDARDAGGRSGDGDSIAALAAELGYQSEAAFNRAFKRHTGRTPGAVARAGAQHRTGVMGFDAAD